MKKKTTTTMQKKTKQKCLRINSSPLSLFLPFTVSTFRGFFIQQKHLELNKRRITLKELFFGLKIFIIFRYLFFLYINL